MGEKKQSAVFPLNLCMVLFLSSSVPFTLFSPLQCLLSPTPNLHLTASSAPAIQSGLFPLHSLFFATVQEEDKRKNVLNFKRTLVQGNCAKKTPQNQKQNQKNNQQNNLKAKAAQFLHTFLVHTQNNVPVYSGSKLKMRGTSSAQSLAKAPAPKFTDCFSPTLAKKASSKRHSSVTDHFPKSRTLLLFPVQEGGMGRAKIGKHFCRDKKEPQEWSR